MSEASRRYAAQHWLPRELQEHCTKLPLVTFLDEYKDAHFLLIRLWDRFDAFTLGLAARYESIAGPESGVAPVTAEYITTMSMLRSAAALPSPEESGAAEKLQNDLVFVWPLRVRNATGKTEWSVGRARSSDLFLAHRSVSQRHAWFRLSADGRLWVRDAGSKNKTFLNDERLTDLEVEIRPGARMRFGAVHATVCSPFAVWTVLAQRESA